MIIVDIEVPVMGKQYDVQIDEYVPLDEVKAEIVEIICQKEQCELKGEADRLLLWDAHTGRKMDLGKSARENGLLTGSRLLLL